MKTASTVLVSIAKELSRLARDNMPKMREGEMLRREWYENGFYYRETSLDGRSFLAEYDFRQRKVRLLAGGCE